MLHQSSTMDNFDTLQYFYNFLSYPEILLIISSTDFSTAHCHNHCSSRCAQKHFNQGSIKSSIPAPFLFRSHRSGERLKHANDLAIITTSQNVPRTEQSVSCTRNYPIARRRDNRERSIGFSAKSVTLSLSPLHLHNTFAVD